MKAASRPEERMFFLIGRGRSGTTLLKSILDAHPGVSVAPEALFIMNLHRSYRGGEWTEKRIRRFVDHLFLERRLRRWQVHPLDIERRLMALPLDSSFARFCADVYEAHADSTGKDAERLLGDKNPHYALFVDELLEIYPDARFIHLIRDYRDNVVSYRNVPFDLHSVGALAYRWKRYNTAVLEAARRHPENFHRLKFEDLVAEPVATIETLCRFLGVQPGQAMLDARERDDDQTPEWHRHLNRPIDARLAGRWQESLSAKQVAIIDRICQPLGSELGYPPAMTSAGRWSGWPGVAIGWTVTALERLLFRFPISLQASIIKTYRRLTGNVIR